MSSHSLEWIGSVEINSLDLQLLVKDLYGRGITLTATEQPISTKDATSKCFLDMLGGFGEIETNLRRERQLEGIQRAKEKGVYKGGKRIIDVEKIKKLKEESLGATATENEGVTKDDTQWLAGLQWDEIGPGTLGISAINKGPQRDGGTEEMAYEAFYSYPVNDGMTITPAVFILENNGASETDETGVVVKTSFSF